MKIIFVTHLFPYPPDDGGRIGFYNSLKYLARRHEMVLVSLVAEENHDHIAAMRSICSDVVTMVDPGWTLWRMIRGVIGTPPGTASKYFSKEYGELIRKTVKRHKPDLVELQHLNTTSYLPYCQAYCPVILREHNIEFQVWARQAEAATQPLMRQAFRLIAPRVRDYEAKMAAQFAECITVSKADELLLKEAAPEARVTTIPLGVDTEYFFPSAERVEEPFTMVLTGSFAWHPKQHNLRVLLTDIFPKIRSLVPEARLKVVGKGMPQELVKLAEEVGAEVTGAVPDVRPYIDSASLVLNYLESGGGIALKVLEAMAMRKPVLSNVLGVEGIALVAGRDAEVVDSKEAYAQAAAKLLCDPERRRALAENGYRFVMKEYAWCELVSSYEAVYKAVLSRSAATRYEAF
jgi:glycosyltransferase involved in cell wall biosynthesis